MMWEHQPQASVSTTFLTSSKLSRVFLYLDRNTEYMFSISFRKLHQDKRTGKQPVNVDYQNVNSLLLDHQCMLVLCLHRVIQTQFLTNQQVY